MSTHDHEGLKEIFHWIGMQMGTVESFAIQTLRTGEKLGRIPSALTEEGHIWNKVENKLGYGYVKYMYEYR